MSDEVEDGVYVEFDGLNGGRGGIIRAFRRIDGRWFRLGRYRQTGKLFELKSDAALTPVLDQKVRDGIYVRLDGERGEILG